MQIKMDTDAVRSMSSRLRQTADSMDASLASIKATVEAAGWQSQAREEFIMRLEMLRRTSTQSATVLRMMAQAADQKAEQWEAIANVFNGPFHSMGNIWSSVIAFFSGIENSLWNAITNIQLPSLPSWVLPSISGATVIGGITSIIPKWEWNPPDWWPFSKGGDAEHSAGNGGGGGSWGSEEKHFEGDNRGEISEGEAVAAAPTKSPSSGYDMNNLSSKDYLKSDFNTYPPLPKGRTTWKGHCGGYVQGIVPGIRPPSASGDPPASRACNWIKDYDLDPFSPGNDLRAQLEPGDVVIWDKGQKGADSESGHAAVIVEVHEDYVILAESSWGKAKYDSRYADNPYVGRIATSDDKLNGAFIWSNPDINQSDIKVESGS